MSTDKTELPSKKNLFTQDRSIMVFDASEIDLSIYKIKNQEGEIAQEKEGQTLCPKIVEEINNLEHDPYFDSELGVVVRFLQNTSTDLSSYTDRINKISNEFEAAQINNDLVETIIFLREILSLKVTSDYSEDWGHAQIYENRNNLYKKAVALKLIERLTPLINSPILIQIRRGQDKKDDKVKLNLNTEAPNYDDELKYEYGKRELLNVGDSKFIDEVPIGEIKNRVSGYLAYIEKKKQLEQIKSRIKFKIENLDDILKIQFRIKEIEKTIKSLEKEFSITNEQEARDYLEINKSRLEITNNSGLKVNLLDQQQSTFNALEIALKNFSIEEVSKIIEDNLKNKLFSPQDLIRVENMSRMLRVREINTLADQIFKAKLSKLGKEKELNDTPEWYQLESLLRILSEDVVNKLKTMLKHPSFLKLTNLIDKYEDLTLQNIELPDDYSSKNFQDLFLKNYKNTVIKLSEAKIIGLLIMDELRTQNIVFEEILIEALKTVVPELKINTLVSLAEITSNSYKKGEGMYLNGFVFDSPLVEVLADLNKAGFKTTNHCSGKFLGQRSIKVGMNGQLESMEYEPDHQELVPYINFEYNYNQVQYYTILEKLTTKYNCLLKIGTINGGKTVMIESLYTDKCNNLIDLIQEFLIKVNQL